MYYKEFLRVRNFFVAFAIALTVLALVILLFSAHGNVIMNMASADTIQAPGIEVSNTNHAPFSILFAIAGFVAAIFATVLGTGLACENSGHLAVAWTRPASRVGYALRLMLVDAGGIGAMLLFTLLLSLALIFLRGWQVYMYNDGLGWLVLARFVIYPLAWYALVVALSASVRGKAGAIAGFSWLGAAVLAVLLSTNLPPAIHDAIVFINFFNPVIYGSFSSGGEAARHIMMVTPVVSILGLTMITILGTTAGLVQWRRLEA